MIFFLVTTAANNECVRSISGSKNIRLPCANQPDQ